MSNYKVLAYRHTPRFQGAFQEMMSEGSLKELAGVGQVKREGEAGQTAPWSLIPRGPCGLHFIIENREPLEASGKRSDSNSCLVVVGLMQGWTGARTAGRPGPNAEKLVGRLLLDLSEKLCQRQAGWRAEDLVEKQPINRNDRA